MKMRNKQILQQAQEVARRQLQPLPKKSSIPKRVGLKVLNCDNCGACCMHMGTPPGFVFFCPPPGQPIDTDAIKSDDGAIWQRMPEDLRAELRHYYGDAMAGRTPWRDADDLPCLWFDEQTRRCKHHEHRPSICREFEIGSEACIEHRINRGISMGTLAMIGRAAT